MLWQPYCGNKRWWYTRSFRFGQENLTPNEISIFQYWVKLVDPDIQSLILGINEILKNSHSIEHYLKIIPKIQKVFQWNNLLKNYHNSLRGL